MNESRRAEDRHGVSTVRAVLRALAAGASADEALDLVAERVCLLLPATEVMILLLHGDRLLLRAGRGIEGTHLPRLSFADGTPVESWVVARDAALFVSDVSSDPRFRVAPGHGRISALAAVPIRVEGEVAGVLEIGEEYKADFRENGAQLALMADVAGIVVEHARATRRACDQASGELLRAIRHDFRSPLTAINGYAQLIQRRANRDARPADAQTAAIIVQQVHRMTSMLDAIRDGMMDVAVDRDGQAGAPRADADADADAGRKGPDRAGADSLVSR